MDATGAALRITPACAGKRLWWVQWRKARRDHPRVCGEKLAAELEKARSEGSPPRVRGKACSCSDTIGESGITPAYAGKSFFALNERIFHEDHPRVCGEK